MSRSNVVDVEKIELVLRAYRNGALSPADSLKQISLIISREIGEDILKPQLPEELEHG